MQSNIKEKLSPQRSVERRRVVHRIACLIQADRQIITFQCDCHSIPSSPHSSFQDATACRRYVCTAGGRRGARRRTGRRWSGHHGACMARGLHHHRIRNSRVVALQFIFLFFYFESATWSRTMVCLFFDSRFICVFPVEYFCL